MNAVVIGAGFCGLATAWSLLRLGESRAIKVTIIDAQNVGVSTSGIAAGLLHPYVGIHCKMNHLGAEGFEATKTLIKVAEKHLGRSVAELTGICRPCLTKSQEIDFQKAAKLYAPDISWMEVEEMCSYIGPKNVFPGIFIQSGMTVHAPDYLQGLWLACQSKGAKFCQAKIQSLEELKEYDIVIFATGAETTKIPELSTLPLRPTKGQLLELKWPADLKPLNAALNSQPYCLMSANKTHCIVGSTYEKNFISAEPDIQLAAEELIPKLHILLPELQGAKLTDCRAGVRATTPNRQPLITKIASNGWVIGGMSSKGLLYHALYADLLVHEISSAHDSQRQN